MERASIVIPLGAMATIISIVAMIVYGPWMPGVVVKPRKQTNTCSGVIVATTDNLQTKIDANPNGTTFCLQAGTHRLTTQTGYVPKTNNVIKGNGPNAVVSGAKVVTGFAASGSDYFATGFLAAAPTTAGSCRGDHPLCQQAEDVYIDSVRLEPVASQAALAAGKVYLDYTNNRIYIRDNPSGKLIEQAWATKIFTGTNTGVKIENLTVQMAASQAQKAAIHPTTTGSNWIIDHNDIRFNHGFGVHAEPAGTRVTYNHVHHNGQAGTGGDGAGIIIDHNEVDHNNTAGYDDLWEAGNKFSSQNFTVTNNYYHDDFGPGIWCDIDCGTALISGNYVAHEWGQGIFYEISCGPATIQNNILVGNYVAGISASASKNVDINNNQIYTDPGYTHELAGATIDDQRGIWHYQQDRGSGACGTYELTNVTTRNNSVELNGPDASYGGKNGLWTATQRTDLYSSMGNTFTGNTYHDTAATFDFAWDICGSFTCALDWAGWQSAGRDATGSIISDNPSTPAPPTLATGPQ